MHNNILFPFYLLKFFHISYDEHKQLVQVQPY